jgi:hypothetical protein
LEGDFPSEVIAVDEDKEVATEHAAEAAAPRLRAGGLIRINLFPEAT